MPADDQLLLAQDLPLRPSLYPLADAFDVNRYLSLMLKDELHGSLCFFVGHFDRLSI